jgi:catechol 2,3-dioxygenase-like lactoylglutathione lyase family enzyme
MPKRKVTTSGLDFNHAMVYSRDVAVAMSFYIDRLGLKAVDVFEWQGKPVYARLRSSRGRGTLALHQLEPGKTLSDFDGIRLYFEIKQLDKFCKRLGAAGVTLDQQPKLMPWGWRHAYLKDPDGHEVSLYWAGAKRFQKTKMPKPRKT